MSLHIDLDLACPNSSTPSLNLIQSWLDVTLHMQEKNTSAKVSAELSIRVVNNVEISDLNEQFRNKAGATNVLSFPCDLPAEIPEPLLGDIVISFEKVIDEAVQQNKSEIAHWAHLLVHGTLHLLGYDHIDLGEAEEMEHLEREILQALGYPDPYLLDTNNQTAHPLQPPSI